MWHLVKEADWLQHVHSIHEFTFCIFTMVILNPHSSVQCIHAFHDNMIHKHIKI